MLFTAEVASCLSLLRGKSTQPCVAWLWESHSGLLIPAILLQEMMAGHMGLHAGLPQLRPLEAPAGLQVSAGLQGATPCTVPHLHAWPECAMACQCTSNAQGGMQRFVPPCATCCYRLKPLDHAATLTRAKSAFVAMLQGGQQACRKFLKLM